jgi:SAM-dependent methyltransferase
VELLVGAGSRRHKNLVWKGRPEWAALTTLDINADHKPDVVHDLTVLPLPFPDNTFDEIHAYEVLEHTGQQGDWWFFFAQFSEFWRILKPDGVLLGTSPAPGSAWAWGDPGHTRVLSPEAFTFLVQRAYAEQVGITPMTDYRFVYKADFEPCVLEVKGGQFSYILQAVKPSRIAA